MKKITVLALVLAALLCGCAEEKDDMRYEDGQLYAAAYLGTDMTALANYTDDDDIPVHYISGEEYYLIIPRYDDMSLKLYKNDIVTGEALIFEQKDCGKFILCCNVSDIFADAVVRLSHGNETTEFSPYISLENGEAVLGEKGLDITK